MASKYITEEEVVRILDTYEETGREDGKPSILKTAEKLHCSVVRVRRVLISEGLWGSTSSDAIGRLHRQGLSTKEIAEKLHMSEKNVQNYLPYSHGAYLEDTEANQRARKSKEKLKRKDEEMPEAVKQEGMDNPFAGSMDQLMKTIFDLSKMTFLLDESVEKGVGKDEAVSKDGSENKGAVSAEMIREIERQKVNEYHENAELVYIDCAPESMGFHSPNLTFHDNLFKARTQEDIEAENTRDGKKRRLSTKLGYRQFLEKFLFAVDGHLSNGSLYELQQKILTALVDRNRYVVPVFINAQFLCDKSGGKYSVYNGAGDMIDTIRWLWDACNQPIILVGTPELKEAVARGVKNGDSNSQKVNWRVLVMRWNGKC